MSATTVSLTVLQAYRFALDPTPRQQRSLTSHTGAARLPSTGGSHWSTSGLPSAPRARTSQCPGPCMRCAASGTGSKGRWRPGGTRTVRKPTRLGWTGWRERSRTGATPRVDTAAAPGSVSPVTSARAGPVSPAGSPPERSGWSLTAVMWPCRGLAGCARTSPPASLPAGSTGAPPGSFQQLSPIRAVVGGCRLVVRCNGRSAAPTGRRPRSAWTSVSATLQCSPTVGAYPIRPLAGISAAVAPSGPPAHPLPRSSRTRGNPEAALQAMASGQEAPLSSPCPRGRPPPQRLASAHQCRGRRVRHGGG